MDKHDFLKILCSSTPQEINEFIASKGKKKMVNAVTFVDPSRIVSESGKVQGKEETSDEQGQ